MSGVICNGTVTEHTGNYEWLDLSPRVITCCCKQYRRSLDLAKWHTLIAALEQWNHKTRKATGAKREDRNETGGEIVARMYSDGGQYLKVELLNNDLDHSQLDAPRLCAGTQVARGHHDRLN